MGTDPKQVVLEVVGNDVPGRVFRAEKVRVGTDTEFVLTHTQNLPRTCCCCLAVNVYLVFTKENRRSTAAHSALKPVILCLMSLR